MAALSGCMEKGPEGAGEKGTEISVNDLKALSIQSVDDLSSYRLKKTTTENTLIDAFRIDVSPRLHGLGDRFLQIEWKARKTEESTETSADMDLSSHRTRAQSTTTRTMQLEGQSEETNAVHTDVYQIENSTYVKRDDEGWTAIISPISADAFWGTGSNNYVKIMAGAINSSQAEIIGSERIDGIDTYKLKILITESDHENLYTAAQGLALQLTQYPTFMPSINRTEFNETVVMEKLVWISKESYLPVKYHSLMRFKMTPYVIGSLDSNTSLMRMFNQSVQLGNVSVVSEITEIYYHFNETMKISPPREALDALTGA
jgi:hypothetical protein